uniref:Secreted protein n=1 Tax=Panagrolaimus sp. JU765 TaxID=591449 RepID=A0AC34RJK8_9BILA
MFALVLAVKLFLQVVFHLYVPNLCSTHLPRLETFKFPRSIPQTKKFQVKHFIDPFSETKAILISIITFKNKPRNQKKRKNTTKKINIIRIGFLNLRQKKASGC